MEDINQALDLDSIDAVTQASVPFKLEMKDPANNSYPNGGLWFLIIGRQADEVNKFYAKQVNEFITKREYARRRGREMEPKTAEAAREDNIAGAAIRVVGWEGVKQSFDRDRLVAALRRNPQWIEQITEGSDDLGNFTKKA